MVELVGQSICAIKSSTNKAPFMLKKVAYLSRYSLLSSGDMLANSAMEGLGADFGLWVSPLNAIINVAPLPYVSPRDLKMSESGFRLHSSLAMLSSIMSSSAGIKLKYISKTKT